MANKKDPSLIAEQIKRNGPHAVFFDIDGTLIKKLAETGVSPRMARAIHEARKNGHRFFLNSGRSQGYINKGLVASAEFDGVVSGLGAHITYDSKTVYSALLPRALQLELIDYCDTHGESIIFEGANDEADGRFSFGDSGFFNVARTADTKESMIALTENRDIIKITIPYLPCAEYAAFLEKHFEMAYVKNPPYAEGALCGNNKGAGIFTVCDILGILRSNTLAVGDSENDIKMLEYAALPVAMGNADEIIKDMCCHIAESVENDGAAALVEQFFL
ncbi:MAG: HAD-IIB family hydrolase [Clostridia bacterium]|nr:HAD-IIB family hydrolase [Clostridia bacterium]